ncbi:hypothetical protein [Sodalis sp.]
MRLLGYRLLAGSLVSVVDVVSDGDMDALIDEYESRCILTSAV